MEPSLTPSAAARLLGVATSTLRSWDRRYGVGPSERTPGGHRRYTSTDIDRLRMMCRLIGEGAAPAEAARRARDLGAEGPGTEVGGTPVPRPGGHTVATGRPLPELQGMARAAIRMDAELIEELLQQHISVRGVVATWEEIAKPLLYGIGDKWATNSRYVEVEHLLSWSVSSVLRRVPRASRASGVSRRGALLLCAPNELHTLPMEALAAALSEAGVPWRMLGPATPLPAARAALRRVAPEAAVLWSQSPHSADPTVIHALLRTTRELRQTMRVITAGPGWRVCDTTTAVVHVSSLAEGLSVLTAGIAVE